MQSASTTPITTPKADPNSNAASSSQNNNNTTPSAKEGDIPYDKLVVTLKQ